MPFWWCTALSKGSKNHLQNIRDHVVNLHDAILAHEEVKSRWPTHCRYCEQVPWPSNRHA